VVKYVPAVVEVIPLTPPDIMSVVMDVVCDSRYTENWLTVLTEYDPIGSLSIENNVW
jgi:hypothetical protein